MGSFFVSSIDRQNQILLLIEQQQRLSVFDIVDRFAISESTARRDLETLAGLGKVQRVHGGAIQVVHAPTEPALLLRRNEQTEIKRRIGNAAAQLVHDGDTIAVGSGSTVLEFAHALKERHNLTVITNSLPVMNLLAGMPDITLVSIGGVLRPTELSFIGHIAEQALEEVRAEKVIIGIHAVNLEQGLTSEYLPEAMTDRTLLRAAKEVILVADHTKFGRVAAALLAPIECVHTVVTDSGTPFHFVSGLQERGIRVITV